MSDVKRYGHISYLVDATPQMLQLYPSMTVYVMAGDYDALKTENESLRKDAARYQWIRDVICIDHLHDTVIAADNAEEYDFCIDQDMTRD